MALSSNKLLYKKEGKMKTILHFGCQAVSNPGNTTAHINISYAQEYPVRVL